MFPRFPCQLSHFSMNRKALESGPALIGKCGFDAVPFSHYGTVVTLLILRQQHGGVQTPEAVS